MEPIDICYTPLDIPIRPDIDMVKFMEWIKKVYPQPCKEKEIHAEKTIGEEYPWDLVFASSNGRWQNNFDNEFPELAKYCYEAFNLKRHELTTVLFLPVRSSINGVGFWHNDIDPGGFRFYIECENHVENPLLLRKTIEKYNTINGIVVPVGSDDDRLQKEVFNCKMPDPHMAYYLNNYRSVHAPMITVPGTRIAVLLTVNKFFVDEVLKRNKNLIVSSANKYKDYAILYQEEQKDPDHIERSELSSENVVRP
jgi:hypothetical protein